MLTALLNLSDKEKMNLLYFSDVRQGGSHYDALFLEAFRSKLPCWEIFTFSSIEDLVETLKTPLISFESIMLLHIHTEQEADKILEQCSLFSSIDIIMILSNTSHTCSAKCYQIYPRLVFRDEPDPMILISTLMKKSQYLLKRHPAALKDRYMHELNKRRVSCREDANIERIKK